MENVLTMCFKNLGIRLEVFHANAARLNDVHLFLLLLLNRFPHLLFTTNYFSRMHLIWSLIGRARKFEDIFRIIHFVLLFNEEFDKLLLLLSSDV